MSYDISVAEAVKEFKKAKLAIKPRHIQNLCQAGELIAKKVGSIWEINKASVIDYLKSLGVINEKPIKPRAIVPTQKNKKYLLTSVQDNTELHLNWWKNLQVYAKHIGAEVLVAPYTYQKKLADYSEEMFPEEVRSYLVRGEFRLGRVRFCANLPMKPTEARPLNGLRIYTQSDWGIFPHPKVALLSIPTIFNQPTKMIMTTGASTLPNYQQQKTGLKAEFHHVIGATLLEFDGEGNHFTRQLNADEDGNFQDLSTLVENGKIIKNQPVEAITWGDIHYAKLHQEVFDQAFMGKNSMLNVLRPKYQFLHDLLDFESRNHHNIRDPHHWSKMYQLGRDNVGGEIRNAAMFASLLANRHDWSKVVVVQSNHDDGFGRWLKEADARFDPVNAVIYHKANLAMHENARNPKFNILEYMMREMADFSRIDFIGLNGGFFLLDQIECGLHGHLGANGSKGSIGGYANMAVKMNVGHSHSASIQDGVYQSGVLGQLDMGYNKGPSSWSHSSIITYPNGKRTIITQLDTTGAWRA